MKTNSEKLGGDCETGAVKVCRKMVNLYVDMVACVSLKFHGGGIVHIILTLWRLQVILKFHGGGNFHVTLTLWRLQVSLKFHGAGSSMGVEIFISP